MVFRRVFVLIGFRIPDILMDSTSSFVFFGPESKDSLRGHQMWRPDYLGNSVISVTGNDHINDTTREVFALEAIASGIGLLI